jgi:hypothetical protein
MAVARTWLRGLQLALVVALVLTLANMNIGSRRASTSGSGPVPQRLPQARSMQELGTKLDQLEPASATEQRMRQLAMMGSARHRLDASFWLGLQQPRSAAPHPVPADCQRSFGSGYLLRWNHPQFEFCKPDAAQPKGQRSSIHCYTDAQSPGREKAGGLQTMCRSTNLLLDSEAFVGGGAATGGSHHGGDHASVQAPGAAGSVRAACSADKEAHRASLAAPSSEPWLLKSLQASRPPPPHPAPLACPPPLPACLPARLGSSWRRSARPDAAAAGLLARAAGYPPCPPPPPWRRQIRLPCPALPRRQARTLGPRWRRHAPTPPGSCRTRCCS